MNLTLRSKLLLGTGLLLVLFTAMGAVALFENYRVDGSLSEITEVDHPANAAAYEMEINIVETAFYAVSYLSSPDPETLSHIDGDKDDFAKFVKQYRDLAESAESQALGDKIGEKFATFSTEVGGLTQLADTERTEIARFIGLLEKIDTLLDDHIQSAITEDQIDGFRKLEAAMELEINIKEISKGLANYLRTREKNHEVQIQDDQKDFERYLGVYESLALSASEAGWASELRKLYEESQTALNEIMASHQALQTKLNGMLALRQEMDSILDDEIQVRTNDLLDAATKDAHQALTIANGVVLGGLLGGVLIGIIVVSLTTRSIVRPLKAVADSAGEIAGGNLGGEALTVTTRDEVGELARVFNEMRTSLRDQVSQMRSGVENLNSSSAQILAAAQQQASSTREQAATVQEVTSTMEELGQSGSDIAEKAKSVATAAEASSAGSRSGIDSVEKANRIMDSIREQVEEVAEKIVALSEKTQAIGEITASVNEVAEQSKLLALNAAIEAASAGQDGNRFSVVAGEMKNLADQAKESTVQVRSILGEIQKGINTSVMLTEEAVKRVETGKAQSEVSLRTIEQLAQSTEESVQAFQQIIGGTNQQRIGFEQVTQGMKDIRQATEQTAAGTSQLEGAVSNLNALSRQLGGLIGKYSI